MKGETLDLLGVRYSHPCLTAIRVGPYLSALSAVAGLFVPDRWPSGRRWPFSRSLPCIPNCHASPRRIAAVLWDIAMSSLCF
jgi:hypothetical protein